MDARQRLNNLVRKAEEMGHRASASHGTGSVVVWPGGSGPAVCVSRPADLPPATKAQTERTDATSEQEAQAEAGQTPAKGDR